MMLLTVCLSLSLARSLACERERDKHTDSSIIVLLEVTVFLILQFSAALYNLSKRYAVFEKAYERVHDFCQRWIRWSERSRVLSV